MPRNPIQLSQRHRVWFYSTSIVLFGSGVAWQILHSFFRRYGDFGPEIHPVEPWMLKLHGAAAMICLVILGTLIPLHVRRAWHAGRNRFNGVVMVSVFVLLILSGYTLYYASGDRLRELTSLLHVWLGFGSPAFLLWHVWSGRHSRR